MSFTYQIPIIPQNLRRDETMVQIADTLNHLTQISNDIFDRINRRIAVNKGVLLDLTNRIDTVQKKITKLSGANKATQVFSSSKYPAVESHRCYKPVFNENKAIALKRTKYKFKELQVNDEPLETLQFFHVKVQENEHKLTSYGLGEIPTDIKSINDLLLYNTGKNPYENYVMSDPLQAVQRLRKDDLLDTSDIAAAPHSILGKTTLTRSATDSYFYSPDLGDVPSIDVPIDLPDLPGIADDLRFVNELGPGIAPSVISTPNVAALPLLNEQLPQKTNDETSLNSLQLPPLPSGPKVISNETVLTKAVPLPAEVEPELQAVEIQQEPIIIEKELPQAKIKEKPPVVGNQAHASLMEAIRKAGGSKNAKLKTAESKLTVAPNGDLMADLHAKLSLRRKGISGTKNENSNSLDTGSAMNKISAMIPPPPTIVESETTNTEDDDWDE